ncbi:hypothetical protein IKS57_06080, partial [bacterium]|nr:hypothetical protein [bacterium]
MKLNFSKLTHNTRTKFAFIVKDDLFYFNDKLLDFNNDEDILLFVQYIQELQLLNASSLITNLNLTNKQINFLNIAKNIANSNQTDLSLYFNTLKIQFHVQKLPLARIHFENEQKLFICYKEDKEQDLMNNFIFIASNYENYKIFSSIKNNSYLFNVTKHTKFEIINNDVQNAILEIKALQSGIFEINDEIIFSDINLNYQIYDNETDIINLLNLIKQYNASGIILFNDLSAQYVINVKKLLRANGLYAKVIACIHTLNSLNDINNLIANSDAIIYDRVALSYYYNDFSYLDNVSYITKACSLSNKPVLMTGNIGYIRHDLYETNNDLYQTGVLGIDCFIYDEQYKNIIGLKDNIKLLNEIINVSEQHFDYENNFNIIIKNSKTSILKNFDFIHELYDLTKPDFVNKIFAFKYDFIFIKTNNLEFITTLSNT